MKPCKERWREELLDRACGWPASAALREHLENCVVCSEALREWTTRMWQIDSGVRLLTESEPSPDAMTRVMAKVSGRRRRAWRLEWPALTAALSGVAVLMAVSIYVWNVQVGRRNTKKVLTAASAIGGWRSPTEDLLQTPADRWLKEPPRLGQYFYPLGRHGPEKERGKP